MQVLRSLDGVLQRIELVDRVGWVLMIGWCGSSHYLRNCFFLAAGREHLHGVKTEVPIVELARTLLSYW